MHGVVGIRLAMKRLWVRFLEAVRLRNNSGQVVHTFVIQVTEQ